jgi:hypothetical protein
MAKPIDLVRVQATEAALARLLREKPELAERTGRFLAGDPSLTTMEALMAEKSKLEPPT